MKQLQIVGIASIFLLVACNLGNEKKGNNNRANLLLPKTILVNQEFMSENTTIPAWQKNFNFSNFIEDVFDNVLNSTLSVFDPLSDDSTGKKCQINEILSKMGQTKDTLIVTDEATEEKVYIQPKDTFLLKEIKSLYFEEEWSMDTSEPFVFEKNIISWCPVRYYTTENKTFKSLIFKISKGNPAQILAKNIIYEVDLTDILQTGNLKNLNVSKLVSLIYNKAISGKAKLYDPMNVDKELSVTQVRQTLGERTDTVYVDDPETGESVQKIVKTIINPKEIESLVFVEDWYYDSKTFAIKKVVKGIAPVRHYYKMEDKMKTIPFVIFTGNEKINIF